MRRRKSPPPLPAIDRRQSMAVNHVAKFVADELIVEPRAFLRLNALGRVYFDWCETQGVLNRRVSTSELLLRLEKDHGLVCGTVYVNAQDADSEKLYGLRGARLRLPELNARQMYGGAPRRAGTRGGPARWRPVIDGSVPDVAERLARDDDPTAPDEEGE